MVFPDGHSKAMFGDNIASKYRLFLLDVAADEAKTIVEGTLRNPEGHVRNTCRDERETIAPVRRE